MQQNQGNLSPQLRAAKFNAMTRENIQTLPSLTATEGQTVSLFQSLIGRLKTKRILRCKSKDNCFNPL